MATNSPESGDMPVLTKAKPLWKGKLSIEHIKQIRERAAQAVEEQVIFIF
jgi:hypothetical protein